MSSPDPATVARELASIPGLIAEVRAALSSSNQLMGPQTWEGLAADRWYGDWRRRRLMIESLLRDAEEERTALLQRAHSDAH